MKRTTRKVLAGALLVGLCQPLTALAADADLQKKMEVLEKELEALKQQMKDTDKKVEKAEEKSIGRWLTISGDYRFRVDSMRGKTVDHANAMAFAQTYMGALNNGADQMTAQQQAMAAALTQGERIKNDLYYTNRFGLNLKAKATENVVVKARLLMYKGFGSQEPDNQGNYFADRTGIFDGTVGHVPGSSELSVDQVYATWSNIADQPVWFSVGRRPSTGGVPSNLKANLPAPDSSGIPALLVDYAFDGMTLGWAPDIETLPGAYLKLCYGRGFETGYDTTGNSLKDTDMLGVQASLYSTDAFSAMVQWNRGMNIFDFPEMRNSAFGDTQPTVNLGDIDWFGLNLTGRQKNVGPGHLNWFLSTAASVAHPDDKASAQAGGMGLMNGTFFGMQDPNSFDDKTGWAVYAGGRYDYDPTGTKIGFEYNHGSKNWITFAPAADDMWTSKLGTRGNVYDAYIIQELSLKPISSYLSKAFFKVGYQYYDFEYTGSNNWVGAPEKIRSLSPMSLQLLQPLESAQDFYATFEVHF